MKYYRLSYKDMLNRVAYLASDQITNIESFRLFRGDVTLKKPVIFKHLKGKKWSDVLTFTNNVLPIFSEKIIKLLEHNLFTGWEKYEIEIENRPSGMDTIYYGLKIIGRCENNLKSITIDKRIKGWDGSDFFTMNDTSLIFISEKVYKCLSDKKNKLSNIDLEPFEDYLLYHIDMKTYLQKKYGV